MSTWPALFVSHGAPSLAIEDDAFTQALADWGSQAPPPRAVVVVSAHWEAPGPRVNAGSNPSLVYDFSGFPPALYELTYPAPGDPALADEVRAALSAGGFEPLAETRRGWDHGVWVPLRRLFPDARIPVVAVSLPVPRTPERVLALGQALAPLREREVLLLGSGGIVHNLGRLEPDKQAPAVDWARSFDRWVADRLEGLDVEAIADYERRAPQPRLAVPGSEHFDPIFFVLGSRAAGDRVATVFEGFHYGTLSLRTFALSAS